ncbi:hypothetical protein AGMMS4956_19350 [Bacteroidia bacterium]|nr:hypothetical protein AGMMS4956_19350 [Bacteroidia bacterium]
MEGKEVRKILRNNGFSLKAIADLMGETPQNLNSMLNAQDIKTGVVEKIAEAIKKPLYFFFPEKVELMTDKEIEEQDAMLRDAPVPKVPAVSKSPQKVSAPAPQGIPLVEFNAAAGLGNEVFGFTERDVKEYYQVPKFSALKVDFMIEVYGSSMQPKYNSGDVVACRKIHQDTFIQWGKVYVLATREQGLLVKRINPSTRPDCLLAVSDNENYKPFDIPQEEILDVALVVGVIRLE